MHSTSLSFVLLLFCLIKVGVSFRCDRRPYGSNTQSSAPDGKFKLKVLEAESAYVPDQLYTVQIISTDGESHFSSFMISAEGDQRPDSRNPRRTILQYPGELRPQTFMTAKFSDRCLYSVEQTTNSLKTSVDVYWQAPPAGNGCVTLRAMVAENEDLWYEDGPPLTVKICEDMRQPDDVAPPLNLNCQICDTAKYEVEFVGIWSRNTHPQQFPENDWVPRYSNLVGASHSPDFILWTPGILASPGMKDLAEYANTTVLEAEIRAKIGDGVRTMIKGRGHSYPKLRHPTYAFFRADNVHHLLTTAVGIHPSPDWYLGVNRFELCQEDNTWIPERELNLYPWDAGTDSGVSYESANIETFPQDAITRVQMSSFDRNSPFFETDIKDMHPFGKLRIRLIRTYKKTCEDMPAGEPSEGAVDGSNEPAGPEPDEPSRYQNPDLGSGFRGRDSTPIETDPDSPEDCPLSQWQEWSPCEGLCVNGHVKGYRWRERYHLVDGVPVDKYDPDGKPSKKEVSEYCKETYSNFESDDCEDDCSQQDNNKEIKASRRLNTPILPGHPWTKKRELEWPLIRD